MKQAVAGHDGGKEVCEWSQDPGVAKGGSAQEQENDYSCNEAREPDPEAEDRQRQPRKALPDAANCRIVEREKTSERLVRNVNSESEG